MTTVLYSSNGCDGASVSGSRGTDTIEPVSDNKSTVDGGEGGSNDATEMAHLAEQLDSISNEEEAGEGGGETLNSITGGLQVSSRLLLKCCCRCCNIKIYLLLHSIIIVAFNFLFTFSRSLKMLI